MANQDLSQDLISNNKNNIVTSDFRLYPSGDDEGYIGGSSNHMHEVYTKYINGKNAERIALYGDLDGVSVANVTTGTRNDGRITLLKRGPLCFFQCALIAGGAKSYTVNYTIPEQYRPQVTWRVPVTLTASGSVTGSGYGHMTISTAGRIDLVVAVQGDYEVCASTSWCCY